MTDKQMKMYLSGESERMIPGLKKYEEQQWKKAFAEGTSEAWKRYRANVKRRVTRFTKLTGLKIDLNALMA